MSVNDEMVKALAAAAVLRFHSALSEGMTEREAFQEIVSTILRTYQEALAS